MATGSSAQRRNEAAAVRRGGSGAAGIILLMTPVKRTGPQGAESGELCCSRGVDSLAFLELAEKFAPFLHVLFVGS